jgi:hypothetical protein
LGVGIREWIGKQKHFNLLQVGGFCKNKIKRSEEACKGCGRAHFFIYQSISYFLGRILRRTLGVKFVYEEFFLYLLKNYV